MIAMILAAGRGKRLRPLTDKIPKPLIKVAGKSLIEYHLQNLADAGIKQIIINTAWLAEKIHAQLGNGANYGVSITYSDEGEALNTAGGIINALPLLGNEPFLVVNGDIWCDFNFSELTPLKPGIQAHIILVDNPEHNQQGDFSLQDKQIRTSGKTMYTYSGIGIYSADFFAEQDPGFAPLAPIIKSKSKDGLISGQYYDGQWADVGTIERLQELEQQLSY
jgi:MurNAc alpha-1-phosphate uridylyltransferase